MPLPATTSNHGTVTTASGTRTHTLPVAQGHAAMIMMMDPPGASGSMPLAVLSSAEGRIPSCGTAHRGRDRGTETVTLKADSDSESGGA